MEISFLPDGDDDGSVSDDDGSGNEDSKMRGLSQSSQSGDGGDHSPKKRGKKNANKGKKSGKAPNKIDQEMDSKIRPGVKNYALKQQVISQERKETNPTTEDLSTLQLNSAS